MTWCPLGRGMASELKGLSWHMVLHAAAGGLGQSWVAERSSFCCCCLQGKAFLGMGECLLVPLGCDMASRPCPWVPLRLRCCTVGVITQQVSCTQQEPPALGRQMLPGTGQGCWTRRSLLSGQLRARPTCQPCPTCSACGGPAAPSSAYHCRGVVPCSRHVRHLPAGCLTCGFSRG